MRVSSCSTNSPKGFDLAFQLRLHRLALAGKFEVGIDIAGAAHQLILHGELAFETFPLAHEHLRLGWIGPDGGIGKFRL